eukprot:7180943-Heterocapsa_arctica.AAC.1
MGRTSLRSGGTAPTGAGRDATSVTAAMLPNIFSFPWTAWPSSLNLLTWLSGCSDLLPQIAKLVCCLAHGQMPVLSSVPKAA